MKDGKRQAFNIVVITFFFAALITATVMSVRHFLDGMKSKDRHVVHIETDAGVGAFDRQSFAVEVKNTIVLCYQEVVDGVETCFVEKYNFITEKSGESISFVLDDEKILYVKNYNEGIFILTTRRGLVFDDLDSGNFTEISSSLLRDSLTGSDFDGIGADCSAIDIFSGQSESEVKFAYCGEKGLYVSEPDGKGRLIATAAEDRFIANPRFAADGKKVLAEIYTGILQPEMTGLVIADVSADVQLYLDDIFQEMERYEIIDERNVLLLGHGRFSVLNIVSGIVSTPVDLPDGVQYVTQMGQSAVGFSGGRDTLTVSVYDVLTRRMNSEYAVINIGTGGKYKIVGNILSGFVLMTLNEKCDIYFVSVPKS